VSAVTATLTEITQKYKTSADFLAVYITEAHARNEWPAGYKLSTCDQPTTREERLILANQLSQSNHLCMPLLVDDIDNRFEAVFAAWPVRFFILQHGMIACKAQPSVFDGYDFNEIFRFLDVYTSSSLPSKSGSASPVDKTPSTVPRKAKKRSRDLSPQDDVST